MSRGNATFGGFILGRSSRLPSNDLPTQARRPRYIQKSKSQLLLVLKRSKSTPTHKPESSDVQGKLPAVFEQGARDGCGGGCIGYAGRACFSAGGSTFYRDGANREYQKMTTNGGRRKPLLRVLGTPREIPCRRFTATPSISPAWPHAMALQHLSKKYGRPAASKTGPRMSEDDREWKIPKLARVNRGPACSACLLDFLKKILKKALKPRK